MLVRLKKHDPRRGHVLRRYTYRGIKFQEERGWYKVEKAVADYLATVHQVSSDEHSPLAFDVCTEKEATALDAKEKEDGAVRKLATDNIKLSVPRNDGALTTADLPESESESKSTRAKGKKE
ncbi:MAG: hypothetical protein JXX14_18865 [Deltaproteobacteria bacterium]|nr:hypothetical protein [Deltaproteobacteria bacterium]MBN2717918.1 hypothetical protein [Deltaproteobacteria bacterium]